MATIIAPHAQITCAVPALARHHHGHVMRSRPCFMRKMNVAPRRRQSHRTGPVACQQQQRQLALGSVSLNRDRAASAAPDTSVDLQHDFGSCCTGSALPKSPWWHHLWHHARVLALAVALVGNHLLNWMRISAKPHKCRANIRGTNYDPAAICAFSTFMHICMASLAHVTLHIHAAYMGPPGVQYWQLAAECSA